MIREFLAGDEAFIAELEKECFSDPWSAEAVALSAKEGVRFFLYERDGGILGYAGLQTVLDEGYVTNIAVTKTARGKGIGRALLSRLDEVAAELSLSFISLEVRVGNRAAVSLYEKCGYERVGTRPGFYENPREDAIIMTKRR